MSVRWRIGKIGQTELWLHAATLLFGIYVLIQGQGLLFVTGFLSIGLHECAHGVAAALCHHPPQEVEVTPLGLLLRLEDEEILPRGQRALILLAGPGMTALLMLLGYLGTRAGYLQAAWGAALFCGNFFLLLLNLLPVLPLDGGRLLALLLSLRFDLAVQTRVLRVLGWGVGIAMVLLALAGALLLGVFNLSLAMVGCFLLYAAYTATTTQTMAAMRQFLYRRSVLEREGMARGELLAVLSSMPLRKLLPHLRQGRYTSFAILECGTQRCLGWAGEDALHRAYLDDPGGVCGSLLKASAAVGEKTAKSAH